jgi:hypothetical protein
MVETELNVPYHQQDTDYYCGAASAQMVLASLGLGLLPQDQLYNDNHAHSILEGNWYTAPDGLFWTLNTLSGGHPHPIPSNPEETVDWAFLGYHEATSEDAISRKICWTIQHYTIAPIALVYGSAHWIVVRGYAADRAPVNGVDPGFSIDHFYVNNPWPPVPSASNPTQAPPPPHSATDGCGTGGQRGIANELITYADWHDTYMTGVGGGYYAGKFIAMCDPSPPAARPGIRKAIVRPFPGTSIISPASAAELAVGGLKAAGLFTKAGVWQTTLERTTTGTPELVQRLDHPDKYYYVVPIETGGKLTAASRVDAKYGTHLGSILSPPLLSASGPGAVHVNPLFLSQQNALTAVLGARIKLGTAGILVTRPETLVPHPTLVWEPCLESLSPYYPFRMFTAGRTQLYVRVDGKVFTKLTADIRGA